MEGQLDSENYWNRSTRKGFSFDDDADDSGLSTVTGNSAGLGISGRWDADVLNDDTISEASFDNSAFGGALNLSIKSIISDEALKVILQEQSLDDRIIPKGVSPEEELKLLRRQVQTTLYSPSAEVTAYKLLLGKTVTFEVFKSLHEKQQLLDTVLLNGGGDAVIGVLLFLEKSLNRQNFHRILQQRPRALQHYLSYLQQREKTHETIELLRLCGRKQESALLQFRAALNSNELRVRKEKLQRLVQQGDASLLGVYQQLFHGTLKLIELIEKERHALDNRVQLNSTPVEVLYACCRKNSNWQEQDLLRTISPHRLCAEQQIAAAQFEWTALNERAAAQAYADLTHVFERVPTWHPMKQKQFHISFSLEAAISRLYELRAPASVLYLFISKMSNANEKLELAQRVKCTRAVIDAFVSLKDVAQLTQLRDSLPERSEEQFYCEKALKGLQSKRWTTDNIKLKL